MNSNHTSNIISISYKINKYWHVMYNITILLTILLYLKVAKINPKNYNHKGKYNYMK